jgi:hypothetical protein
VASKFLQCPPPGFRPHSTPVAPPCYKVRLLYDNSVITSKLYTFLSHGLHCDTIKKHILKKTGWSSYIFSLVHWDAHECAFKRLTLSQKCITAKLVHGLANTNRQNQVFYNASPTCPCCQEVDESFEYVLVCGSSDSSSHRNQSLQDLTNELKKINTPEKVLEAILVGMEAWITSSLDPSVRVRAPTAGSLRGGDMLLTTAFMEQHHSIGWYQFALGRISSKWEVAVRYYNKQHADPTTANVWAPQAILILWKYTKSLWLHRNKIVHGRNGEETAARLLRDLHEEVRQLYDTFQANPAFLLPRHHYLFTNRSLDQRLRMPYDNITCWLRSVEEAQQALNLHESILRNNYSRFFSRPHINDNDSFDETYVPSSTSDSTSYVTSLSHTASTASLTT